MNGLLTHTALLTLSMSFIILLVLLFIKTFGNRFSAKSRYMPMPHLTLPGSWKQLLRMLSTPVWKKSESVS